VTPTLDELLAKFRGLLRDEEFKAHAGSMERYFRLVASGMINPVLTESNAVMAAQCVVVILEHVKNEVEQ
jgi:hypothetical protein